MIKPQPKTPIMGGTLIGAPKIADFPPLTGDEFHNQLKAPLLQAFNAGVDVNQIANLPLFVLAKVVHTIEQATAEASLLLNFISEVNEAGLLEGEEWEAKMGPFKEALAVAKQAREKFEELAQAAMDKVEEK
jgi:hypothetical protein